MPTLQEIIDFNLVSKGDADDIAIAMNEVANKSRIDYAGYYKYEGDCITMDHVVGVRREVQTSVLRYDNTPFAVITCAGQELGDTSRTYIIDSKYAAKAMAHWLPKPEFKKIHNKETHIKLGDGDHIGA